jgi:FtsP/CotA-like multicopper oxidase with cupredoxin domain
MTIHRRRFLKAAGTGCLMAAAPPTFWPASAQTHIPADYTLRIATGLVELAPQHVVSTTLYDGQFPGPLLRFKEGKRVRRCLQRHRHS